jgi:hypothetical protein
MWLPDRAAKPSVNTPPAKNRPYLLPEPQIKMAPDGAIFNLVVDAVCSELVSGVFPDSGKNTGNFSIFRHLLGQMYWQAPVIYLLS